jgi:SAM-dependent methyltransferase
MRNPYNKYYLTEEYFGKPYPGLVEFFKAYSERGNVLDLGCGQGRDALFLGRIGYQVTGIDISDIGIQRLNKTAQIERLKVKGFVADIFKFGITDEFDMVLLDSILHFYKNDFKKEKDFLTRVIEELKPNGVLCNFMQKGSKREHELKNIIFEAGIDFIVLSDGYTEYPEYNSEIHMYIIKKL